MHLCLSHKVGKILEKISIKILTTKEVIRQYLREGDNHCYYLGLSGLYRANLVASGTIQDGLHPSAIDSLWLVKFVFIGYKLNI